MFTKLLSTTTTTTTATWTNIILRPYILTNAAATTATIIPHRTIHLSMPTFAEPLRKKKVINPLITKKQFERKVRRLEREIAKLQTIEPKLKPILEHQLPTHVKKDIGARKRPQTVEDVENEKWLNLYLKIWSIYQSLESNRELELISKVANAQQQALNVLQRHYPQLYTEAINIDPEFIPYRVDNVKKDTSPNTEYICPDGKDSDVTKEWKL